MANVARATTEAGAAVNSPPLLYGACGSAAAAIGNGRYEPVTAVIMAIRRWAWLTSSVTTTGMPLQPPHGEGVTLIGGTPPAGGFAHMMSIPVFQAGALLAGAATAADTVFLCRPAEDFLLWESSPRLSVSVNPLATTLQVRLRLFRYTCFIPHGWPLGIAQVQNCPQPTGGFSPWRSSTAFSGGLVVVPRCLCRGMPNRAARKATAERMDQEAARNRAAIAKEKVQAGGRRQLEARISRKVGLR